jgi:16S rRNA (guanine527-N7)-methyltransferase
MGIRRQEIENGLECMGIPAGRETIDALARHLELVLETNKVLNLTSIDPDAAVPLHVLDSCSALPYLMRAPDGPFADIGSGPGYPGIPLALLTHRPASLVESVRKKAAFLERTVEEIRLEATVHPFRAEELALEQPEAFAAVTARALSALPSLVELAAPLLVHSGLLVCLKGRPEDDELRRGDIAAQRCGLKRIDTDPVSVPGVDASRTIVVYRRESRSSIRLPRRNGLAQRQPLA